MKLLDLDGLADKGIQFSDTHIWRLVRAGDFPKPVKIGNRNHWVETDQRRRQSCVDDIHTAARRVHRC